MDEQATETAPQEQNQDNQNPLPPKKSGDYNVPEAENPNENKDEGREKTRMKGRDMHPRLDMNEIESGKGDIRPSDFDVDLGDDLSEKAKFEPSIVGSGFEGADANFFGRMGGMFGDATEELTAAGMSEYGSGSNYFHVNYPSGFDNPSQPSESFGYDMPGALGETGALGYGPGQSMFPDMQMLSQNEFALDMTPDSKLRPAALTDDELRKELAARGLLYQERQRMENIARLVAYLLERNYGMSDLSSNSEPDDLEAPAPRHGYNYLEVILVNCDSQRKPLLDWLETWKNASKDVNSAEIFELPENNLIKIRIFNKFAEPSGVIDQLNSVKIKCARYYCYSRGENWGGWEYYENGFLQKQEAYNADEQPPPFWRQLCWLENAESGAGAAGEGEKVVAAALAPRQVSAVLGTDEEMVCVDCGNYEKVCRGVHGSFNGQFKSKDLYSRCAALMADAEE